MSEKKSSFGKWIIVFILLFLVAGSIAVIATMIAFSSTETIENNSILKITISGDFPDVVPVAIFGDKPVTFSEILATIKDAAGNDKIKAILLDIKGGSPGFAKVQELRDTLVKFKESGKSVYAFFEYCGNGGYYLSTVADEVYMIPVGEIYLVGISMEATFLRGFFDKIGVEPNMMHHGKYKSYSDMFTQTDMPEAMRESYSAILDSIYSQMVKGIATTRNLPEKKVKSIIDNGPFSAEEAVSSKLVDKAMYWDELKDYLMKKYNQKEFTTISLTSYVKSKKLFRGSGDKIAVVIATGGVVSGKGSESPFGGKPSIASETYSEIFRKIREDDSIKGILFRVDSPGGSAIASDVIWREQFLTKNTKPMVVSMGNVAASGGYYISATGDAIVAEPGTITGSIGVVTGKFNMKGLYDWLGINKVILKRGRNADIMSDYQGWIENQEEKMNQSMMSIYWAFVDKVAEGRGMSREAVDAIAQGRIWTGEQALDNGLVDKLGGYEDAMELLKKKAGISDNSSIKIVNYPKSKTFFEIISEMYAPQKLTLKEVLTDPEKLNPFGNEAFLYLSPQFKVK